MATTTDSSPRGSGFSADGVHSPLRRRNLSSPWAQIVRGETESMSSVPHSPTSSSPVTSCPEQISFSECSPTKPLSPSPSPSRSPAPDNSGVGEALLENSDGCGSNAGRQKKPAWNKPSNDVVEVGPVMGAVSWPALSESTRASPRSSSDSPKPVVDGSAASIQGPVIPHSPQKQVPANTNPNSSQNHASPFRQRSIKSGGGSSQTVHGHLPSQPPPPPPPYPLFEMPQNKYAKMAPQVLDSSTREPPYRNNTWETRPIGGFVPQPRGLSDHPLPRNSRRGNFGPHPRGDGPHHNNYGGRRDQDRGNYEWNSRSSNVRDIHMQPQRAPPRGFIRAAPQSSSPRFMTPQPIRPFMNPAGYPDMPSQMYYFPALPSEPFRSVPFVAHAPPPPMFIPVPDPPLPTLLVNQIEYYFSDVNLIKDDYLRSYMDDQGWVPITLIAGFPRVQSLTNSIPLILDSLRTSTSVEVQGDKVRRRNEWMKWLPSSARFHADLGLQSPGGLSYGTLVSSFQKVTVEEGSANQNSLKGKTEAHTETVLGRASSEEFTGESLCNGRVQTKTPPQAGADQSAI